MIKCIVVEDELPVRQDLVLLTRWENLGIVCVGEASNGSEGIELFERFNPDIIITDIRMPEMDGISFISAIKELCESQKRILPECIILSGFSEFEYARSAITLGVSEYLLKPISDAELEKALGDAIKRIEESRRSAILQKKLFNEYRTLSSGENEPQNTGSYVDRAVRILLNRYVSGVSIEDVAREIGVSTGHLSRLFKQETGYTFLDYLMNIRVKRAAELLQDPTVKIYEVADFVGYTDARYFAQVFRKITGMTPTEFRDDIGHTTLSNDLE